MIIEIAVTPREKIFELRWLGRFLKKIPAQLYSIIGLVAAY